MSIRIRRNGAGVYVAWIQYRPYPSACYIMGFLTDDNSLTSNVDMAWQFDTESKAISHAETYITNHSWTLTWDKE